jgi:hypothetical protein
MVDRLLTAEKPKESSHKEALDVPILLLVFNRPEITRRVFQHIRSQRPTRLYIAADGPRPDRNGEWQLCYETRAVVETVDWACRVQRLYRDRNLGCGRAVSEAISWFFDQEEEGIVLEDDCLPSNSFFSFCQEMLNRYRDDPQIGTISGDCFFPTALKHRDPYFFSKYVQIWGWATWRRFWRLYEYELSGSVDDWHPIIQQHNPIELEARYWTEVLKGLKSGLIDTWDYQMIFVSWRHSLVHVAPTTNLVQNVGYGDDATHTTFRSFIPDNPANEITNFKVDLPIRLDQQLDQSVFFFRFLESFNSVWWLHQAIDVDGKLGWARWESKQAQKQLDTLAAAIAVQQDLLRKYLRTQRYKFFKFNWLYALADLVNAIKRESEKLLQRYVYRPRRTEIHHGEHREHGGKEEISKRGHRTKKREATKEEI